MPRYGTTPPQALYLDDQALAWGTFDSTTGITTGETVQPSVPVRSQAFALADAPGGDGTIFVGAEIIFGGAPGAFSIQFQEAGADAANSYITQSAAAFTVTTVTANNVARTDLNFKSKFFTVLVNSLTNNVSLIVRLSR